MMASPAAMAAGFMEARTIEAAAAGEAANGKLDGQMHSLANSSSGHQRLFRGSMQYKIKSFQSPISSGRTWW